MASIVEKNHETGFVKVVVVVAANTGEQCPSRPVQDGVSLRFRARPQNIGYVYLAFTLANVTATDRVSLAAGDSVGFKVNNANLLFVALSVANEGLEIFAEGPGGA